jgi:glycosyltransferase involved in cell wall biosynthesis
MRGGEKVLEQLCMLFPGAPIYALVSDRSRLSDLIRSHPIRESFLQRLPQASRRYKSLLPLFPTALAAMRVDCDADFLFSSDASVLKGLSYDPRIPHVCYCHSPPRYLWELQETYLRQTNGLGAVGRAAFRAITPYVREFDRRAAGRVTHFIGNSRFVEKRIRTVYGRDAAVIYPPVAVGDFCPDRPAEDFYLIVSELVAYKRVDLAIEAFNRTGKKLVVLGDGAEGAALRARANSNIEFLGRQPFDVLRSYFERCRAFIHPQIEDFGITAVEAQAAGRPVLALRQGGALETVVEGVTGLFFDEQTPESLAGCIEEFENRAFSAAKCRENAERFRPEVFRDAIRHFLSEHFPGLFPPGWEPAA